MCQPDSPINAGRSPRLKPTGQAWATWLPRPQPDHLEGARGVREEGRGCRPSLVVLLRLGVFPVNRRSSGGGLLAGTQQPQGLAIHTLGSQKIQVSAGRSLGSLAPRPHPCDLMVLRQRRAEARASRQQPRPAAWERVLGPQLSPSDQAAPARL